MAMLLETEGHKDNPSERVDLVDHNSSDYDQFLSDAEATETGAINYEIPPPPPRVTVTVHLDDKHNELKKYTIRREAQGVASCRTSSIARRLFRLLQQRSPQRHQYWARCTHSYHQ